MVCPICDRILRDDERLIIGPTKNDGFFSVTHVRYIPGNLFRRSTFSTLDDCVGVSWNNRLKIDTVI